MAEHVQHIPANKKDREKFAKDWKADRDFKESEKSRRFAEIDNRRKNKPTTPGASGSINVEINSD